MELSVFNKHIPRIVAQTKTAVLFFLIKSYKGLTVKAIAVFGKLGLAFQSTIYPPKICFVGCRSAKSKEQQEESLAVFVLRWKKYHFHLVNPYGGWKSIGCRHIQGPSLLQLVRWHSGDIPYKTNLEIV